MSWFSRIAGQPDCADETERRLLNETALALMQFGISDREAREIASQSVEHAKKLVKEKGLDRQPDHLGDAFLAAEANNAVIHDALETLRAEGVRNDDILDWWNRPALERVMLEEQATRNEMAAFIAFLKQGLTPETAGEEVLKTLPHWGVPNQDKSDDRPLPVELHARFTRWTERNAEKRRDGNERIGPETLNAAIRRHMREGTF